MQVTLLLLIFKVNVLQCIETCCCDTKLQKGCILGQRSLGATRGTTMYLPPPPFHFLWQKVEKAELSLI